MGHEISRGKLDPEPGKGGIDIQFSEINTGRGLRQTYPATNLEGIATRPKRIKPKLRTE
jgi:hypothetical protein